MALRLSEGLGVIAAVEDVVSDVAFESFSRYPQVPQEVTVLVVFIRANSDVCEFAVCVRTVAWIDGVLPACRRICH